MRQQRGFTLVELLVALFAMALLAILSWRGLDGMSRAQQVTQARADEVLTLQVGLQQFNADLEAMQQVGDINPIDWNGRVLRITRRGSAAVTDGVVVAAWTRRVVNNSSMWLRWQSPQSITRGDLQQAWQLADLWAQNQDTQLAAREVVVTPLLDWQVFFYRENAWTNPQSSAAQTASPALPPASAASAPVQLAAFVPPDGVRVQLTLPEGQAISGQITRDWVRPTMGRTP